MNNKKTIIVLLLMIVIGIVGLTIAYFAGSTSIDNTFTTKSNITKYTESFISPDNWLPGDTTEKTLIAKNMGDIDQAVRIRVDESWTTDNGGTLNGWIHPDGSKSTHSTEIELSTDERVALLNLTNTSDWTKVGNYYYYNYKLAPGEDTNTFLESVTFNSKTKLNDTCETTVDYGTTSTACSSSGNDYDNATYTLTLTIETVQYDLYASAWNTDVEILEKKPVPGAQYLLTNATNPANTEYNTATKGKMFAFSHEATYQTPALTDYRYIGDNPNNYIYFNCDDMSNQSSSTCEVWRIIGVFDVDDGTGNVEQRIKLVRGSSFATKMEWNSNRSNDWTSDNATLKEFLNGDYYSQSGDASIYGLKISAQGIIGNAKYYLGAFSFDRSASTEQNYLLERGNTPCMFCNGDEAKTTWIGIIGLMYPSDMYMTYKYTESEDCYNHPMSGIGCAFSDGEKSWIYISNILEGQTSTTPSTWFLSPGPTNWNAFIAGNGCMGLNNVFQYPSGVRPVVYLKSSVEIDSGTGTELDPYKLK